MKIVAAGQIVLSVVSWIVELAVPDEGQRLAPGLSRKASTASDISRLLLLLLLLLLLKLLLNRLICLATSYNKCQPSKNLNHKLSKSLQHAAAGGRQEFRPGWDQAWISGNFILICTCLPAIDTFVR